jgi:PHD/YefM family antitoxin component YafN of YafNO toxin-antitoxin module
MDNTLQKLSKHTFNNPDFHSSLQPSLLKSKRTLEALKNKFDEFTEAWLDILKYFGEDPNDYVNVVAEDGKRVPEERRRQPVYVFVSLDLFFQAFKDAVHQHREEETRRKAKERRNTERQRRISLMSTTSSASPSRGQSGESISSSVTLIKQKLGQQSSGQGDSSGTIFKQEESGVDEPFSGVGSSVEESLGPAGMGVGGGGAEEGEEDLESFAAIFDSTKSLPFAPDESTGEERLNVSAAGGEVTTSRTTFLKVDTSSGKTVDIPPRTSSTSKRQRRPSSVASSTPSSTVVSKKSSVSKLRKDKALQRLSKEFQNFSKTREVDIDNVSRSFTDQILLDAAQGKVGGGVNGQEEQSPESVIKRYSMSSLALMDGEALDVLKGSISLQGLNQDLHTLGDPEGLSLSLRKRVCPNCQMEKEACECHF